MDKRIYMSLAFVVGIISVVGAATVVQAQSAECGISAERRADITKWVGLYDKSELAYNDLWKAIARAGSAPAGYISPNVSPGINQGAGVTDSLDGKTILRADLYYAHDEAAKARQACRNGDCDVYTLPSTHSGAQTALTKYINAIEAMPKFAGPAGMMSPGSAQRMMSMHDARALSEELTKTYYCSEDSDRPGTSGATAVSPTATVVPPTTATGTYTLEYVTGLLTQIQTLTNKNIALNNENATLRAQLAAAQSSYTQSSQAQTSASTAAGASSGSCPALTRSLSQGASGFDVSTLQTFLARDPAIYPEGQVTAYFGPATERAVGRWQLKNSVVTSASDAGYGSAGPRTRAALLAACQ